MKTDQELLLKYEIVVVRPGGNDTAFVKGVYSPQQRKSINDAIMRINPSIEQVGFITTEDDEPVLMMAGGEFCGNATRALAWLALEGKCGEVTIKTSGVDKRVKSGVDKKGDAWVEIPVDLSKKPITRIDETIHMVELDSITHLTVKVEVPFNTAMKIEDIKSRAVCMLDKFNLRETAPAAGVMFVSNYQGGLYLEPVVWVRSIETLFYETACGSGTAAVGLVFAKELGESEKGIKVIQPSGLPIWVNVIKESISGSTRYVRISGPVERV